MNKKNKIIITIVVTILIFILGMILLKINLKEQREEEVEKQNSNIELKVKPDNELNQNMINKMKELIETH